MNAQPLDGRVAVVTGAAQGIGQAIARTMGAAGAAVAVMDRDGEGAERTAGEIRALGVASLAIEADLTQPQQVESAFKTAQAELGTTDVLVNNAGILRAGPMLTSSVEDWDAQFNINSRASFLCVQAAARQMVDRGEGGAIVVVTSNCARTPRMDLGAYCASKAASDMMARVFAMELAQHQIRVNSLCPGSCDTELQRAQWRRLGIGPEAQILGNPEKFRAGIPMGRLATPQDVANMALTLSTDASAFVTGQSIHVDGGQTMP